MGDRLATALSDIAGRLFGPVFALEMVRIGRRWSTFLVRWTYLLLLVGILGMYYWTWRRDVYAPDGIVHPNVLTQFAEQFFWVYAITQFLIVSALTPAFTAAAITDEKERKTLVFLLVTDLSGREILFGKLGVRIGVLISFILAGLPVLSIMQFFGGIEPRLLFLSVGMTLVTVLSLTAISAVSSVLMSRTRDAVVFAYAVPLAYLFFSSYLRITPSLPATWQSIISVIESGNPFVATRQIERSVSYELLPTAAVWYLGFHVVVTLAGLAFAALRLRASAAEPVASGVQRGRFGKFKAWVLGRRATARPHPPLTDDPMRWREVYVEPGSSGGIVGRLLTLGVLAAVFIPFLNIVSYWFWRAMTSSYSYSSRNLLERFQDATKVWVCAVTCGIGILMLLRATIRGASSVAGERDRDTWISLLTTPLSIHAILRGKWAGCVWGQRNLMLLLGVVWAIGVLTNSVNLLFLAITAMVLGVYLYAFAWLGIWCSISAQNSRMAIARAIPTAILFGGGYWIFLMCCCAGFDFSNRFIEQVGMFIAGLSPPAALAGLPAIEFELFDHLSSREVRTFFAGAVGCIVGALGWILLGATWSQKAREALLRDTHRKR